MNRRVLLIGLMGTGKSTVGRRLAARLEAAYVDNDELVLRATGAALEDLRRRDGTAGLRAAESAALQVALALPPPVVAGVAAGVVTDAADLARLATADATVVWLRATPATLATRVAGDTARPWLQPDPLAAFSRMAAERYDAYAQVSDVTVDVDGATPDEVVGAILRAAERGESES